MKTGKKSTFSTSFKTAFAKNRRIFSAKKSRFVKNANNSYKQAYILTKNSSNQGYISVFTSVKSAVSRRPIFHYLAIFIATFGMGILIGKYATPVIQTNALEDISVSESTITTIEAKSTLESASFSDLANANSYTASAKTYTASANSNTASANTATSVNALDLYIPGIVNTNLAYTTKNLPDPDYGPLQYGSLIYGHRSTVFYNLPSVKVGQIITVRGKQYKVSSSATYAKTDAYHVEGYGQKYTMDNLYLYNGIVIMICDNGNKNRWLVFAEAV